MSDGFAKVGEPLGEENWPSWSTNMRAALKVKRVWSAVESPPEGELDAAGRVRKETAWGLIALNLTPANQSMAMEHETAYGLWQALEQRFAARSAMAVMGIEGQLVQLCREGGETMQTYISRGKWLYDRLRAAGASTEEHVAFRAILRGAGEQYNPVALPLLLRPKEEHTIDLAANQLLQAEQLFKLQAGDMPNSSNKALFARGSRGGSKGGKNGSNGKDAKDQRMQADDNTFAWPCRYCKRKGHKKEDCGLYKRHQAEIAASAGGTAAALSAMGLEERPSFAL